MTITKNLLTLNKYSRPGTKLSKVTKIAIHYVGNAGSSALGNRNYFESLKSKKTTYASSHYIIGLNGEIIQCVPENEIAYCTNAANSYSISIECCHPLPDGKFNDKTNQALIELCSDLCVRYKLNPLIDLIRHYDVTGKKCPLYYVNDPAAWGKLKNNIKLFIDKGADDEVVDKTKVLVNGKEVEVERVFKNDTNYVKLRDLEKFGVKVDYDAVKKIPILTI